MSKSGQAPAAPLTRKQLSRVARERRQRQYILIGAVGVAVLVVAVILFGIVDQAILRPRQAVARVGSQPITTGDFVKAARFQRYQLINQYVQIAQAMQLFGQDEYFTNQLNQIVLTLNDSDTLGRLVLDVLIEDRLIRAEAAARGITVSPTELDAAWEEFFGFFPAGTPTPTITNTPSPTVPSPTPDLTREAARTETQAAVLTAAPTLTVTLTPSPTFTPTASPTTSPTPTEGPSPTATSTATPRPTATPYTTQGFATLVRTYADDVRRQTGLTEADVRYLLESQLYREKLQAVLGADVPLTHEQVNARHILVADEATALEVLARLRAGEDFFSLAVEYSLDTSNSLEGGDLGWFSRGDMVAPFEEAAFTLAVNAYSDPVQTSFGWHILQVMQRRDAIRTASELEQARQQALTDWLTAQKAATQPDGRPLVEIFDTWRDDVPDRPALPTG
jgi:parvulin-like peptidyl-prolyl isomerase